MQRRNTLEDRQNQAQKDQRGTTAGKATEDDGDDSIKLSDEDERTEVSRGA